MAIYQLGTHTPSLATSAYIASSANIIGQVIVEADASIWFGATLRGDNEPITIGQGSNVQENCILHTDLGFPLTIGEYVTVGHQATLHGCTIGDNTLIGIQAVILNGAKIGKNSLVGAGALITEKKSFPDNVLILGSPAKVVRTLTLEEIAALAENALHYIQRSQTYQTDLQLVHIEK